MTSHQLVAVALKFRLDGILYRGAGGDRGRGGNFNRTGETADQGDAGTAIGTWTNESEANPKTDSWGDVWADEDNQWTGMCGIIPPLTLNLSLTLTHSIYNYTTVPILNAQKHASVS